MFIIAKPENHECIKNIDTELFEILNIVKSNEGILSVLQKQANQINNIELFNALLRLKADSSDETKKIIKNAGKNNITKILTVEDSDFSMPYCFFGYYKIQMDANSVETSFGYVDDNTEIPVLLEILAPSFSTAFHLYENNFDNGETNLQNLLFGNKLDKKKNMYEITIPVFLNAPPFLEFDLNNLKIPITFQQNITLFSLADKQSEYILTGFLCTGFDGPKEKSKAFFKYKGQWQYFDDLNKIQRFEITSDLKTIYKDQKSIHVTKIFYSKNK
ncbi:hypothetical protein CDIK_2785 [Cucumispora dikerogammari]|nr:hypothetical protein CDIK_2785 [Cucumispora dikerogammari]